MKSHQVTWESYYRFLASDMPEKMARRPKIMNFKFKMKMIDGEKGNEYQKDKRFVKEYIKIEPISLLSPQRAYNLYKNAKKVPEGSFAQVGVYRGGSAKLISSIKSLETNFYLFDTFEGLPKHTDGIDVLPKDKFNETSLEKVMGLFEGEKNIHITKGIFPETASIISKKERFSFVYSDVDQYKSNLDVLEYFYPKMVKGGIIIFDDYDFEECPGIRKSIEDYTKKYQIPERPIVTTKYQCMLVKGATK